MDRVFGFLLFAAWCVGIAWHGSVTRIDGRADVHARFAGVPTLEEQLEGARSERALVRRRAEELAQRNHREAPRTGGIWMAHLDVRGRAQIWGEGWNKPFEFDLGRSGFTHLVGLPPAIYTLRADRRERLVRVKAGEVVEILFPLRSHHRYWTIPSRKVVVRTGAPAPVKVGLPRTQSCGSIRIDHPARTGRATVYNDAWIEDRTFKLRPGGTTRVLALPAGTYSISLDGRTANVSVQACQTTVAGFLPKRYRHYRPPPPGSVPPGLIDENDPAMEPSAPVWLEVRDD